MRTWSALITAAFLAGTTSTAVLGQASGPATKADVNCALYAECAVEDAAPQDATTPPDAAAKPHVRSGKTRGFSMTGAPPSATPARPAPVAVAPAARVARPVIAATPGVRRPARVAAAAFKPKLVQAMQSAAAVKTGQLITFRSGSAELTAQGIQIARQLSEAMLRPDKLTQRFSVQGHTDAVGSRALNLTLSQRRAGALATYLVAQGVSPSRLDTVGYGFDQPLPGTPGMSPDNRRVEIKPVS